LQKLQLIQTWEYHKTANGLDYIVTYYPGQKFFYDQKQKDTRRDLAAQIETGKLEVPAEPPQPTLIDSSQMILSDILDTCGDHKNEPSYRKIVATYSEPLIRMALSETRQAHREGRILKTKGAYFTDTLKRLHQMREQRGIV
jgi:hypothetical protein